MWIINSIVLKNFMSYEDQLISFKHREATIIQGVNLTDKGFKNNGSGKSAIIEGLSVGLLNLCLRRKTTPKDMVRRGEKECTIILDLKNNITKEELTIDRRFYSNTNPSKFTLTSNQNDYKNLISVGDGNKKILELLDITREDLLNYFIVSSEKFESFFGVSDTAKKDLIGRFSNSNLVDVVIENQKLKRLEKITTSEETEKKILVCTGIVEGYEELIVKKEEDEPETATGFKKKVNQKIKDTEDEIVLYKKAITKETIEENEAIVKRGEIQEDIEKFRKKKEALSEKKTESDKKVKVISGQIDEVQVITKQLEMKLLDSVECPECFTIFNPNSKKKIDKEDIKKNIGIAVEYEKTLDRQLEKLTSKKITIDEGLEEVKTKGNQLIQDKQLLSNEITRLSGVISNRNTRMLTSENLIVELRDSIKSFQEVDLSKMISELRSKIKKEEQTKKGLKASLGATQKMIEKFNYWILTFIKFKTHLSNKVIKVIECFINEYLDRMNTDVRIKIEGYKVNKDGTIKESISVSLERDGEAPFATYSNGERARVEIAAIFAIQKLINTSIQERSSVGGLEFTFLDEIIDSVDSEGMFNIMKTLQTLEKTISVISHVAFEEHSEEMFNTITVVKENKISTI